MGKLDTLAGIAIRYGVQVAEIKRANGLHSEMGMFALGKLRIPKGKLPPNHAAFQTFRPKREPTPITPAASAAVAQLRGYYGLDPVRDGGGGGGGGAGPSGRRAEAGQPEAAPKPKLGKDGIVEALLSVKLDPHQAEMVGRAGEAGGGEALALAKDKVKLRKHGSLGAAAMEMKVLSPGRSLPGAGLELGTTSGRRPVPGVARPALFGDAKVSGRSRSPPQPSPWSRGARPFPAVAPRPLGRRPGGAAASPTDSPGIETAAAACAVGAGGGGRRAQAGAGVGGVRLLRENPAGGQQPGTGGRAGERGRGGGGAAERRRRRPQEGRLGARVPQAPAHRRQGEEGRLEGEGRTAGTRGGEGH